MPEYLYPGVYVEEVSFRAKSIEGVSTSTTGFVSVSSRGPLLGPLSSFADFEHAAPPNASANLSLAVRGYFDNGGQRCFISHIAPSDPLESGLSALDAHPISIVCCPDDPTIPNAPVALTAHCEKRKDRVCILQSSQPVIPSANHQPPVHSSYAAYYYPWLTVPDLHGTSTVSIPPCGHVAGIYAQTDTNRGVWKAPDNVQIVGVQSLSAAVDTAESDILHSRGINSIRSFPAQGIRVWSAVTTSPDPEWKYVNIRRYLLFLEHSIDQGTQWAVFEPNSPALWAAVCARIQSFLFNQWKSGALQGQTAQEAYFVRCGRDTMTQSDIDNGRLVILVGIAPLQPAEFVIIQITILTSSGSHPPGHP
jgi:uncharacterized protein